MKFPSLFRTPRHQRFDITPRYYDPVKEEIEARISQMESELKPDTEENMKREMGRHYSSRISGSFTSRTSRRQSVNMRQVVILLLLVSTIVGYWYFGNLALYIIIGVSSLLLYLNSKRII